MGGFGAGLFGPWECEPHSATVSATVVDAATRDPIAGAHVYLPDWRGVTTDAQGTFTLTDTVDECWDILSVEVRADGYLSVHTAVLNGSVIELYRHRPVTIVLNHGSSGYIGGELRIEQPYQHGRYLSMALQANTPWTLDSVPRPAVLQISVRGDGSFPYLATSLHLSPTAPDTVRLQAESAWIDLSFRGEGHRALYAELPAWQLDGRIAGVVTVPISFALPPAALLHVAPGAYVAEAYGTGSCGCTHRVEVAAGDTVRVRI
jgi:hypothetical protein